MRRILPVILGIAMLACSTAAEAAAVDPDALVIRAGEAYNERQSYADVRAVLSEGLREARREGVLDGTFAITYAMYANVSRFDGDPSFALQLTDEGLDLMVGSDDPDPGLKSMLLVSRAYALADLGRYEEAVEASRITALWMGEQFGPDARAELEKDMEGWAEKANSGALPSVAELALDLLAKAEEAVNGNDTGTALTLAARAVLPADAALDKDDVIYVNARSGTISAVAYTLEGRFDGSMIALRRALAMIVQEPWDERSAPRLLPPVRSNEPWQTLAWDLFSNLANTANNLRNEGLAEAALAAATEFATTPERRYTLMVQRAAMTAVTMDFAGAEIEFGKGEAQARRTGDEKNARLAHFYAALSHMLALPPDAGGPEVEAVLAAANEAADAYGDDLQSAEFVLSEAVTSAVTYSSTFEAVLPVARRAMTVFRQRQDLMAGYDSGQESERRARRRFLESFIAAGYGAAKAEQRLPAK